MSQISGETKDQYLTLALRINALLTAISLLLIFTFITKESLTVITSDSGGLIFDDAWYPSEGQFNLVPMLSATFLSSIGALLLALPLGILAAIFAIFYAPPFLKSPFRRMVELYASLPSVIFGFWGLTQLVPLVNSYHPPGQSLLAGILVLALMIFPILTLNLMSGLELATLKLERPVHALGIRTSTFIWSILLPQNRAVLFSASILALGRAIGETMAVLMVCGNIPRIPESVFAPVRTLTANIALEMGYAMEGHRSALFATGLVLLLLVAILVLLSQHLWSEEK